MAGRSGAGTSGVGSVGGMTGPDDEALRGAKAQARRLVDEVPGVCGVGIGDGTVRVYVERADVAARLPPTVAEVPVEVVVTGVPRALDGAG